MTSPSEPEPSQSGQSPNVVPARLQRGCVVMMGIFLVLVAVAFAVSGPAAEQLLVGWLTFPLRVLPQVTVNWPMAALGVASMIAFVIGLHKTMKWLTVVVSRRQWDADSPARQWSFRSTLALSVAVWLLFGAGTAMVAVTHQSIWLMSGMSRGGVNDGPPSLIREFQSGAVESERHFNLWNAGNSIQNFTDTSGSDILIPGGTMRTDGTLMHGWPAFLGSFMGFTTHEIDFSVPWNQSPNDRLYRCANPFLTNPGLPVFDDEGYGYAHIAANQRVFPVVVVEEPARHGFKQAREAGSSTSAVTDGLSNTLFLGEVGSDFVPWGHPANVRDPADGINQGGRTFGSQDPAALFLLGDGSVRWVSEKIDPDVLRRLASPADGEEIPERWDSPD